MLSIGGLVWVDLGSSAWLGRIEEFVGKQCYVFFFNSWYDRVPHGGGLYDRDRIHPIRAKAKS